MKYTETKMERVNAPKGIPLSSLMTGDKFVFPRDTKVYMRVERYTPHLGRIDCVHLESGCVTPLEAHLEVLPCSEVNIAYKLGVKEVEFE